jgi:hypothetical protein
MEKLMILIGVLGALLFVSFLLSWPVYMLWNGCFVDAINGVNEITWLQAWGLSVLFGLLFKTTITSKS